MPIARGAKELKLTSEATYEITWTPSHSLDTFLFPHYSIYNYTQNWKGNITAVPSRYPSIKYFTRCIELSLVEHRPQIFFSHELQREANKEAFH